MSGDCKTCWVFRCDDPADTLIVGERDPKPTCETCAEEFVEEGRGWQYAE